MRNSLQDVLNVISRVRILVVGDVMLDCYLNGEASRLSPEAPVPIVNLESITNIPGGAANVATNISSLGSSVFLAGVVGDDDAAGDLSDSLNFNGIDTSFLYVSKHRATTTKTRVVASKHQLVRIDTESKEPLEESEEKEFFQVIKRLISEVDLIVLSDYAKGCLTRSLVKSVVLEAKRNSKPVVVDPKGTDFTKYKGVTLLTPNLTEVFAASRVTDGNRMSLEAAVGYLFKKTSINSILVTLSENGMKLFRRNRTAHHFPALARNVYDVTGAGDTVVATLAVALGAKSDITNAIYLANMSAGLVVEKAGTSTVSFDELREAILIAKGSYLEPYDQAKGDYKNIAGSPY